MKKGGKRILISGAILALIIGIAAAFLNFSIGNDNRIASQNEEYLSELTSQRAVSINSMMDESLHFIETTAYLYGESLTSKAADVAIIRRYEDSTSFEMLRFIDENGDNYTSSGVAANLSDREYFKSGMRGESGVTYVAKSRVTGQRQLGFYSPVQYDGEIIGVMVGFYGEDYIKKTLDYELFGYDGEGWLCTADGNVIGSTDEETPDNYLEFLETSGRCTADEVETVKRIFASGDGSSFNYLDDGIEATAYIVPLDYNGWILIRSFPPAASQAILRRAGWEGTKLLINLIIIFAVFIAALLIYYAIERRRTQEANKNANDISVGVANMFDKFAVLDLRDEQWTYIEGDPDDSGLPMTGNYKEFYDSFLSRVPDETQRKETEQFVKPEHLREVLKNTDTVSIRIHAPLHSKDFWYTYNFIVIERDEDNNPVRLLVVRVDATELHETEEQDRRRLQDALGIAERASQAKTEFLFNMSHDIRTPMNAIMGYTDIARSHSDDKEMVADSLDKIKASSEHLLSLINDILDMSRIESGKLELHEEDFSLTESLSKLQDLIRMQADQRKHTITFHTNIEHPVIHGDSLRLNQVLLNILSNAVKYTENEGHIDVFADELPGEQDGQAIYKFRIKDDGIGMSEEYLPHLFENFSREYNTTISGVQGTGLGMAIVKNLIDMMGGTISVESKLGEGSEFTVTLPAAYIEQQADEAESDELNYSPEDIKGLRLLLAEDNMINAEIAKMLLLEAGFEVTHVENGRLAAEAVAEDHSKFDAVLMDVQMPEMNGYEATRAIREIEAEKDLPKIPVIAMTANTFEDDKKNAAEAGMDAHIGKPYQKEEMLRIVTGYAMKYRGANQDKREG